jgi:tetratricopeptide (TPR) repeat protein
VELCLIREAVLSQNGWYADLSTVVFATVFGWDFRAMNNSVNRRLWRVLLCLLLACPAAAEAFQGAPAAADPRVGKRVLVIRHGAPLRTPDATVSSAWLGEVFTVSLVNGEWLWIQEKGGWLWEQETVLYDGAIEELTARVTESPTAENYHLRGVALLAHKQYRKAIIDFNESLRKAPKNSGALNNRGKAHYLLGGHPAAIADFTQALAIEPTNVLYLNNRALAYIETAQFSLALADLQSALKLVPDFAEALNNRGIVHQRLQKTNEAVADFTAALKLNPKYVDALGNRAFAYRRSGQYENALADLEQAVRISPLTYEATNDLAWLLSTCPDQRYRQPERALQLAKAACEMTQYQQWNTLDTLAAALAESGQFAEASKWAATAAEKAPEKERARLQGHLEQIVAGKQIRE